MKNIVPIMDISLGVLAIAILVVAIITLGFDHAFFVMCGFAGGIFLIIEGVNKLRD
jgi:hypothetical protein